MRPKSPAAVELGKLRWKGKSVADKRDHALMMVKVRRQKQKEAEKK